MKNSTLDIGTLNAMTLFALSLMMLSTVVTIAYAANVSDRRCTDAHGTTLYTVTETGRVTLGGTTLGRVELNGDVYNATGTLIAHNGDAGLLCPRR